MAIRKFFLNALQFIHTNCITFFSSIFGKIFFMVFCPPNIDTDLDLVTTDLLRAVILHQDFINISPVAVF